MSIQINERECHHPPRSLVLPFHVLVFCWLLKKHWCCILCNDQQSIDHSVMSIYGLAIDEETAEYNQRGGQSERRVTDDYGSSSTTPVKKSKWVLPAIAAVVVIGLAYIYTQFDEARKQRRPINEESAARIRRLLLEPREEAERIRHTNPVRSLEILLDILERINTYREVWTHEQMKQCLGMDLAHFESLVRKEYEALLILVRPHVGENVVDIHIPEPSIHAVPAKDNPSQPRAHSLPSANVTPSTRHQPTSSLTLDESKATKGKQRREEDKVSEEKKVNDDDKESDQSSDEDVTDSDDDEDSKLPTPDPFLRYMERKYRDPMNRYARPPPPSSDPMNRYARSPPLSNPRMPPGRAHPSSSEPDVIEEFVIIDDHHYRTHPFFDSSPPSFVSVGPFPYTIPATASPHRNTASGISVEVIDENDDSDKNESVIPTDPPAPSSDKKRADDELHVP